MLVVTLYAIMVAIWGTTWFVITIGLRGLGPLTGVGARFIVAALFLYAVAAAVRTPLRSQASWKLILVLATCLFGGNYILTYLAETHLASGLVAVLFGTLPFFVFGLEAVMLRKRISPTALGGAILAFGGVALISLDPHEIGDWPYVLAVIVASALSAYANVYLKKYGGRAATSTTLAPSMLVAGIAILALGLAFERLDVHAALAPASLFAVLYLAVLGSGIAFYINAWLLAKISAAAVGLSALMIPVIAVFVGAFLNHEALTRNTLLGAIVVLVGIAITLATNDRATTDTPEASSSR